MRNKKIISLVCALAMLFTMFSAFTVVNAEDKGIALSSSLSEDGKTITLEATAVGITAAANFTVNVEVPEGVTKENIKVSPEYDYNILSDGTFSTAFNASTAAGLALENGKLVTVTMTLEKPLSSDFTFTLVGKSAIKEAGGDSYKISAGTLAAASTKVAKWQDPNKKPDTVDRPAKEEEPEQPEVPTPVVPTGKGIALDANLDSEGRVVTINAKATGGITAAANFTVNINIPEGVTKEDITVSPEYDYNILSDGTFSTAFNASTAAGLALEDGKLVTITMKLPTPLKEAYAFTLVGKSAIKEAGGDSYKISAGTLTAASAVIDPNAVPEPKPVKTVDLKNYVGNGYEAAIAAVPEGKAVYLTVDVLKKDGSKAVYGTDYKAYYPDENTPLTEAYYNNLIHGYIDGVDMTDVINKLKFKVFSADVNKILTTLNAEDQKEQLVDPVDKGLTPDKPAPTPKVETASMTLKAEDKEITVNTNSRITATIKDVSDATEVGTDVTFEIVDGTDRLEFTANPDETTYTAEIKNGVATARVSATKKTGKAKVKATYTYKDKDGKEVPVEKEVIITVKKADSNGGGGSDSSSGSNGPIAMGGSAVGNTQSGAINFVDLDTVTWAQDAILRLVDKKVINGRSNTIFDPNGTVTRAEFAKMVVLGFGLTGGAPGNFSDVDTSAWYNTYVQIGYANDVISGYDDGTFRPNGLISRQEMAAMISRAVKAANKTLPATVAAVDFTDVNPTTEWGYAEISALQTAGVINGMTATTYEPYSNATRAQAAVIIDRAMTNAK